jgi:phosphatidylserine/phosphatidylglycerophosphate/cardiolipin synthase-like enzyme/V8-like Glu-specific endopeptidase
MATAEGKNSASRSDPLQGLESPFLDRELFTGQGEEEWEAHLAHLGELEVESPFLGSFEQPWAQPGVGTRASSEGSGDKSFSPDEFVSSDEFEFEEPGIISGDNRIRVKDTTGVPWRWICKIDIADSRGRPAESGTGVLISSKHVLTAAHVVYDAFKNMQQYTITVIPALNDLDEPFDRYSLASKPKIRQDYNPTAADSLDWDYALLTLSTAVGEKKFKALNDNPLCYWASPQCGANTVFARLDPRTLNGKAAYTAGYPGGKGGKQLWCAAGMLHSADEKRRTMSITADTTKGQSGSPVWVIDNKRHCLVGIAVGAGTASNRLVRVTRELVRQLRAWITEGGETPAMVEAREALEPPVLLLPQQEAPPPPNQETEPVRRSEAEDYEPPAAEWSFELGGEQTEDFTGVDYEESESQVLDEQPLEERFDPTAVPKDVANALGKQDWVLALKLAIQEGWRNENDLTNLVFFARHPELPKEPLKRDDPNFKQLSAEWAKILDKEVWKAIETSSENADLVVSGKEVTDHHRSFFRGKSGDRLKKLVEDAAKDVDLNPGLLGTIMMAETRRPASYLSSEKVSSYHIGCDDFYEARAAIKARVPAYAKVKWDTKQKPVEHLNDARKNPRLVKTILFDSGSDAALATAIYVKFREVRLREIAAEMGKDFDSLPLPARFALTRMAMAAGTGGATPYLKDALNGVDIFVREAIPVREYQTKRNATVRTAQAMHLSDWIFGISVEPATRPAAHESEAWDEQQEDLLDLDSGLEEERGGDEGEADTYEVNLEENEFRVDRLPQKVRAQFSKTDSAAWRNAIDEAIGAGVKDPKDLADLIFFMQHHDRVVSGVGKPINPRDPEFFKLREEWTLYHTIASRRLNPSAPCSVFLPANPSNDYEKYVAKATTGRMILMINGRTSGTNKTEAFDSMQQTVESLGPNDTVYLAAFQVNPTELTGPKPTGVTTWSDLFVSKADQGVKIRIIMTDIPEFGPTNWKSDLNDLNAAIGRLPVSARDNLKYVVSMHPAQLRFQVVSLTKKIVKVVPKDGFLAHVATHHQKFMVVRKSGMTIAYCGGLDISPQRTPQGWPNNKLQPAGRLVWHDTYVKLEGLIARDLEREFVLRWNREKDKSTAAKLPDWKPLENLAQVPLGSADREATKNTHKLQMLRTVSAGATTPDIRRDDVWQGYFRLIGCATRFLFMENQYFHEPTMADAIVKQAEAQSDLIIIIVVAFQIDDPTNQLTEHGRAQQNEFFKRLSDRIPRERLRVYTMFGRLVHSKLILADDQALSVGSTNADPRDFFMDTQLNVILDDPQAVKGFRHQLWSHDLGVTEAKVAGWGVSDFIPQWELVANANNGLRTTPERMTGEAVVPFDPSTVKGKLSAIPDILSEVDGGQPGEDTQLTRNR